MTEVWRDVEDWEAFYEVSDQGRVRSRDRILSEKNGRRRLSKGRLLTPCGEKHLYVQFRDGERHSLVLVHRLVATAFVPNPSGMTHVLHYDDNPQNNTAANLRWGDDLENRRDAIRNGRVEGGSIPRGSVEEIRKLLNSGSLQKDVARIFGVDQSLISRISTGKRRKNG